MCFKKLLDWKTWKELKLVVIRDYGVCLIGQGQCWGLGVKGSSNFFIMKRNMQENTEGKGKTFVTQFIPEVVKWHFVKFQK